ncbi:MAG TPA: TIM barrel protein [Dehalococcoidia bacterium]|nr:TIM barrel protein [Dehalococcoidia bacterium]
MPFRVGPGGTPEGMTLVEVTRWLAEQGFATCELDFKNRFSFGEDEIEEARGLAGELGISYRAHAPLFAILAMEHDSIGRVNSIVGSLTHAMKIVGNLGGSGITTHPGFLKGLTREERITFCRLNGEKLEKKLADAGYPQLRLGVENMAHGPDFGSLDDLLAICEGSDFMRPVIDWGHYQAHSDGELKDAAAYTRVLERIGSGLGRTALEETTYQFSAIEYKDNRERKHLPYAEGDVDFNHLLQALTEHGLTDAYIVSESPVLEDAQTFRAMAAEFSPG